MIDLYKNDWIKEHLLLRILLIILDIFLKLEKIDMCNYFQWIFYDSSISIVLSEDFPTEFPT